MNAENYEFEDLTPSGNTGSMNTIDNGLRALVDWVSITFRDVHNLEELCDILQLDIDLFEIRESGFFGYRQSAVYGHIICAWDPPENTTGMGSHVDMSGQGCREYEQHFDLKFNWSQFFALVMNFDHKFSRLDIATDDFKGYFSIDQVYKCAKRGCMTAKRIKKFRNYEDCFVEDGSTDGRTFYVGKTDWQISFYDKLAERNNKGVNYYDALDCWNRYEIRFRNELATEAAHVLAYEAYTLGEFAKGFMSEKIDFKIYNSKDSNKSRWKSQRWWLSFLNNCKKLELTQVAPDPTIERVGNWLNMQVDTSLATYLQAFDNDELVLDYFVKKGSEKMGKRHERMLEEFKKNPELKKLMYDDMKDFVQEKTRHQTTTVL